jgi:hypothetical protein
LVVSRRKNALLALLSVAEVKLAIVTDDDMFAL